MISGSSLDLLSAEFNRPTRHLLRDIRAVNRMMRTHYERYDHDYWDPRPQFNNGLAAAILVIHSIFQHLSFLHCVMVACVHFVWDDEPVGVMGMVRELEASCASIMNATAVNVATAAMDPRIIRAFK